MSKANSVPKVLRVAIRRVEKSWGTGSWAKPTGQKDENGKAVWSVCLEGAIYGFCNKASTDVQREAIALIEQILYERGLVHGSGRADSIPGWNDAHATQDEVISLLKDALIRAETGGLMDPDEFEITQEELDEILKDDDSCEIKTQEEVLNF